MRSRSPVLALIVLATIGTIGFVDRIVVSALVEPLKAEFDLNDAQIGLLGFAYSALNIVIGVYIARIAERRHRLTLTVIGTLLWSAAATGSGYVQTWTQLLLARIAVGIGEAVGLPANQSIVADYFPPQRRSSAMSILLLAAPLGALIGLAGGGYVAQVWGWRWAFIVTGLPGIALALIAWLFVAEPPRGAHDPVSDGSVPSLRAVMRRFIELPSLRHLVLGSALASLVGYGLIAFLSALLTRRFALPVGEAGLTTAAISALPAAISVAAGGLIADRIAVRWPAAHAVVPAVSLMLAGPLFALAMVSSQWWLFVGLVLLSSLLQFTFIGVTTGSMHNMMHPRMRATANALTNIFGGIVGGLGPVLVGWTSDRLASSGYAADQALGLAMAATGLVSWWAAAHYMVAARTIAADVDEVQSGRL